MLCVMMRCLYVGPSLMISVIPVHKLTSAYQFTMVKNAAATVEKAGGIVLGSMTDNHKVNQQFCKLFDRKTDCEAIHPLDAQRVWFLLYDTVHLLKCIQNNWLSEKCQQLSIDCETVGSFSDIIKLYQEEKDNILKSTSLTSAAVSPSHLQLQSVRHVLSVFNDRVIAALKLQGASATAEFIQQVLTWWNVVNVSGKGQDHRMRDPNRSVQDETSDNLQTHLDFFKAAKSGHGQNRVKCLTHDTKRALVQTMEGFIALCNHLFSLEFSYVLLRELQSDRIEGGFSVYRQSTGMTIKNAHQAFQREYLDEKIGLTLFQSLRPRNVRLMGSIPIESCLCTYCTNVRLQIQAINRLLGTSGQLPLEKDMLSFLCCPYEGRWPSMDCVAGKCDLCCDRMRPFRLFCRDIYSTPNIKWQRWQRNCQGKMEPYQKEGTLRELLKDLEKDLLEPSKGRTFLEHLFTAYWQYSQFKECRTNPEEREVVMVQDFGENRKAAYTAEIKSAHFGKQQVTVHPVVAFYRAGDTVVRDSLIFLTDDITHDHQAVQEFTRLSLEVLRKKTSVKKLTIWSDGAASQYKGRGSFHDLTLLPHQPQRCYYGSEHGKGEADGETGVLSQALKRAVYEGHNLSCAKDMVEYLSKKYATERRQYILVPEIERTELGDDVQTIPGTQKYPQFQALKEYVLQARRFPCFCTACREGRPKQCVNAHIVGQYAVHKCKPSVSTLLNQAFVEEEAPETPSVAIPILPKVGDMVKLTCYVNKVAKTYYAMVLEVTGDAASFSVRFLEKSGSMYAYGQENDVGLIKEGHQIFMPGLS